MKRHSAIIMAILLLTTIIVFPAAAQTLKPLEGWRIVIDSGQGMELEQTPFFENKDLKTTEFEAEANHKVALFLEGFLKRAGAEVLLSRKTAGATVPTENRVKAAMDFEANLILSIHMASLKNTSDAVCSAFFSVRKRVPSEQIARHISLSLAAELGVKDGGANSFPYPLLEASNCPAVMISTGNLSNKETAEKAKTLDYNRLQAMAILKAMMSFQEELSGKTVEKPPMDVPGDAPKPPMPGEPVSSIVAPRPAFHPAATPLPVAAATTPLPALPATAVGKPPLIESPAAAIPTPLPPMPMPQQSPPNQPSAMTLKPVSTPARTQEVMNFAPEKGIQPILGRPIKAPADQSWLYGETWGSLTVRKGISFDAPANTDVRAAADGIVEEASITPPGSAPMYHNCVIIRHDKLTSEIPTMYTVYGKLESMTVKKGAKVKKGDVIGKTGAPSTDDAPANRATEFEFQVRLTANNEKALANPELYIEPFAKDTGMIVGRITDSTGALAGGLNVSGAHKPTEFRRYNYSMTYDKSAPSSPLFRENLTIGDVPAGVYYLRIKDKMPRITVESGKVTYFELSLK